MKKINLIFFILILLVSCNQQDMPYLNLSNIKQLESTTVILNKDIKCVYPIQIQKVDSVLVIMDLAAPKYYFHIYGLDGKFLKSFGLKGRASNEILSPKQFFTDVTTNCISVYQDNSLVYYDIKKILAGAPNSSTRVQFERPDYPIINTIPLKDGNFYLGFTDKMRFMLEQNSGDTEVYKTYPDGLIVDDELFKVAVMSYGNKIYFSPDKSRFVQGTYIGASLETFNISDDRFDPISFASIYPSIYKQNNISVGAVSWNENTTIGFDDISTSNTHLYTLLSGAKGADLKKGQGDNLFAKNIVVFDWDTEPLYKIHVGEMLISLTVDEKESKSYAMAFKGGAFYLVKSTWSLD